MVYLLLGFDQKRKMNVGLHLKRDFKLVWYPGLHILVGIEMKPRA